MTFEPRDHLPPAELIPCLPQDTAKLQRLLERLPGYYQRVDGAPAQPQEAELLQSSVPPHIPLSNKYVFFLALEGETFGVVELIRDYPEPSTAFIGLFLVAEDLQGRGLGRLGYEEVEAWVQLNWSAKRVRLGVVDANPGAQLFWQKQGFSLSGEVFPYASGPVKSQVRVMVKVLAGARRPFPVLQGERCVVRTLRSSDIPAILDYFTRNQTFLAPWEPQRPADFLTPEYWQRQLQFNVRQFELESDVRMAIFEPGWGPQRMLGTVNISQLCWGVFQAGILGYGLDGELQGKGFMHEALSLVIRYAFEDLNLHRLMANVMPRNARSLNLLDRLGFEREGYARSYLRIAGVWEDHVLTALTNAHWKASD